MVLEWPGNHVGLVALDVIFKDLKGEDCDSLNPTRNERNRGMRLEDNKRVKPHIETLLGRTRLYNESLMSHFEIKVQM